MVRFSSLVLENQFASTGVVYGPSDRFITFSQLSIGLAA